MELAMTKQKTLKMSEIEAQILSENICKLLSQSPVSENKISQALGLPLMTLRRLALGKTTDPRLSTLKLIADYFNVSIDALITKATPTAHKHNKPGFIPLLDWTDIAVIETIDTIDLSLWKKWQPVITSDQFTPSENAFALESRPSMQARFPRGAIFIIDPKVLPRDGDIILFKIKKNNDLSLRELRIDPPVWELHSLIPGSESLTYTNKEYQTLGVVIQTVLYNRSSF